MKIDDSKNQFINEIEGAVITLGDNISTTTIHHPNFFSLDKEKIKEGFFHSNQELRGSLLKEKRIIFAGKNFGCGSSREVVALSLLYNGIRIVFAKSFASIFQRNCLLNNILCIPLGEKIDMFENNDNLYFNQEKRILQNRTKNIQLETSGDIDSMIEVFTSYKKLIIT